MSEMTMGLLSLPVETIQFCQRLGVARITSGIRAGTAWRDPPVKLSSWPGVFCCEWLQATKCWLHFPKLFSWMALVPNAHGHSDMDAPEGKHC